MNLEHTNEVFIQQRFELAELMDYETRNKYEILEECITMCMGPNKYIPSFK